MERFCTVPHHTRILASGSNVSNRRHYCDRPREKLIKNTNLKRVERLEFCSSPEQGSESETLWMERWESLRKLYVRSYGAI
jgi:hypothetical protein